MWNPWKLFMNKDDVDQSFSSLISRGIRIEENAMVGSEALRIDGNIRMDRICMDEAIIVSNTAQINVEYLQAKRMGWFEQIVYICWSMRCFVEIYMRRNYPLSAAQNSMDGISS